MGDTLDFNFKIFWMDFCHYAGVEQGKLLVPSYEPSFYLRNPAKPQPLPEHLQKQLTSEASQSWYHYWNKYWWNEVLGDIMQQKGGALPVNTPNSILPRVPEHRVTEYSPLQKKRVPGEPLSEPRSTSRLNTQGNAAREIHTRPSPGPAVPAKRQRTSMSPAAVSQTPQNGSTSTQNGSTSTQHSATKTQPFLAAKQLQEWLVGQLAGTNLDGIYNESSKRFRCNAPGCVLEFINKTLWRQHAVRHLHVPLICSGCGKRCDEMAALLNHTKKCPQA